MENNENLVPEQENPTVTEKVSPFADSPYITQQPEAAPKPAAKVSPFADSPYVMHDPAAEQPQKSAAPTLEDLPPVDALPKERSGKRAWKIIVVAVVLLVAMIPYCICFEHLRTSNAETSKLISDLQQQIKDLEDKIEDNSFTGNGNSVSGTGTADGLTPGQVYAQNRRSVVCITATKTADIYGQTTEATSLGSGFIISEDGYIVTNRHVIDGATKLTVTTEDDAEYTAALIGYDDRNDFALLKIEATGLAFVKLGSSDDLIVGDQVVAVGNALGQLSNSLTVGYISAKDRDIRNDGTVISMLQTDAAINSGNSGGPLFNMKGEVIGITTSKYSGQSASGVNIEGIGFAVPIDEVKSLINELIENGFISAPYMGVNVSTRTDGMGVYVESVEAGTPAEAAGLKSGDIIVGIGEYTVTSLEDLDKAMRDFEANDTTTIFVYRNRQVLELSITFAEKNQAPAVTPAGSDLPQDGTAEQWYEYWLPNFGG